MRERDLINNLLNPLYMFETLINKGVMVFAKYLRKEKQPLSPRSTNLNE